MVFLKRLLFTFQDFICSTFFENLFFSFLNERYIENVIIYSYIKKLS